MTMSMTDADGHVSALLPEWINGTLDAARAQAAADHVAACATCRAETDEWRRVAAATQITSPTSIAPLAVLNSALRTIERTSTARPARSWWRQPILQGAVAASLTIGILAAVIFTPVGSYAQGLITIFQPKQIVALPVSLDDLLTFRELQNYGTIVEPARIAPTAVGSAAEAAARAHLPAPLPASVPAGLPTSPSFYVLDGKTGSFTFSAARAAATAQKKGSTPPLMPASIDGSQISVTTAPAVVITYQDERTSLEEKPRSDAPRSLSAKGGKVLVVARSSVPTVKASGASIDEIERYLLAQPGVSPKLAQSIRNVGDPTSVLPIPVPIDKALSHPVTVQGIPGLAVADSTGLGGGIIWERDGVITGVGGTFTESELLAVANSIK